MIEKSIREVLKRRMALHPEDSYALEKCWEDEISVLCSNVDETISFMEEECTEEEFSWLSEVFEEVLEQTGSEMLRRCFLDVAEKYSEETKRYHVLDFIKGIEIE